MYCYRSTRSRKAQSSVELAVILGFVFLVFMGAFTVSSNLLLSTQIAKDLNNLNAVGEMIASEIKIAHSLKDGYYREFYAPATINGLNYEVFLEPSSVSISTIRDDENSDTLVIFYDGEVNNAQIVLTIPLTNISDASVQQNPGWSVDPLGRKDGANNLYDLVLAKEASGYKNVIEKIDGKVWISVVGE